MHLEILLNSLTAEMNSTLNVWMRVDSVVIVVVLNMNMNTNVVL